MGKPSLFPLVDESGARALLMVQIDPARTTWWTQHSASPPLRWSTAVETRSL